MKNTTFNIKKTYKYIPAFLIPFFLISSFAVLYGAGFGTMFPQTISVIKALFNGLASLCFFIFLKKSKNAPALPYIWQLLLSVSYGLCSHALIPSAILENMLLYSFLPIFILCFEDFMLTKRTLYFYIVIVVSLFIEPVTTTALLMVLFLILLIKSPVRGGDLVADAIHYIFIVLFAIGTTAIFSLPAYQQYFDTFEYYGYPGFDFTMPLSIFFSRLFAGAVPTTYYAATHNISLYFELFFLILAVLYFFCNKISLKERLCNLLVLCILLGILEISSLQYVFDLFTANQSTFLPLECLVIFLCLLWSGHTLSQLKDIKIPNMIGGMIVFVLLTVFALGGSYMNFHSVALSSNLMFLALYIVIILLFWKKPQISIVHTLVYLFIGLELICNLFLVTNQNIFPTSAVSETHFIWETFITSDADTVNTSDTESDIPTVDIDTDSLQEEYDTFTDTHTDYVLTNVIMTLLNEVELSEEDYTAYNEYGLLTSLDKVNAACRKIGTSDDLFIPCELTINYPESELYSITPQGGGVYNLFQYAAVESMPYIYINYTFSTDISGDIVIFDSLSGSIKTFYDYKSGTTQNVLLRANTTTNYAYNYQLCTYQMNPAVYDEIPDLLVAYREQELANSFSLNIYYVSLFFTIICVFLLLLLYVDKKDKQIKTALTRVKIRVASLRIWPRISTHTQQNYVYYLAFFIPTLLYVMTMIVFDCIPFGPYSFFDEDGISSSLPSIMGGYYNTKYGNTSLSPIAGYGYSPYAANNTFFVRAFLNPFSANSVPVITLLFEAIFMGLTALSMAYYLTHRLSGRKAKKGDYRVLTVALIYTLNTYMLAVHCFPTWYYVFMALPLLMLAFDRLMYKKTWGLYVFALSFCIFTNIHLSIFVCIFLVIWFFTYKFSNFKDFLSKGFRFAFFSLLTAGCNFFRLIEIMNSKSNSLYQENDSILPTFGFFTSFWDQWKQLFAFTPSIAVNKDSGHINLYMGIFTLFLIGIYITSRKITTREKLCKLIPILILTISFNENVLSYIWNGLHYQSNVPNRYVFLLMFICATISYDALCELKQLSTKRSLGILILLAIFLILCQVFEANTTQAFVATLVLLTIYALTFIALRKQRLLFQRIACGLLILELTANMFFTVSNYGLLSYTFINDLETVSEFANTKLEQGNTPGRISTPGSFQANTGMIYNIPSGSIFNSLVSSYQSKTHHLYGFLSGLNYTTYNYNSTPLGLALSGHKYIFIPKYSTVVLADTSQYQYIGNCGNYFIYENPNVLSIGIYVPEAIREMHTGGDSANFHNNFVNLYTTTDTPIYELQTINYTETLSDAPNSFSFTDENMNSVTLEEAQKLIADNADGSSQYSFKEVFIHMNLASKNNGNTYLYLTELVPIGNITDDKPFKTKIPYPNPTPVLEETYDFFVFNQDVFEEFMTIASQNQMENVVIDNNRISGTTHYEKSGYTMLSIPYDDGWSAYIDGKKIDVLAPYDSFIMFETPAGDHEIELIYERSSIKPGIYGTLLFIGIAIVVRLVELILKRYKAKKERL